MFKTVIGRGHPEFSTNRQQDAEEFFTHLLSTVDRVEVCFLNSRCATDYNLTGFLALRVRLFKIHLQWLIHSTRLFSVSLTFLPSPFSLPPEGREDERPWERGCDLLIFILSYQNDLLLEFIWPLFFVYFVFTSSTNHGVELKMNQLNSL